MNDRAALDYIIGSVHYLRDEATGRYYAVDGAPEALDACVAQMFGGDALAMARAYYALVAENVRKYRPEIIGHFDLVKKNNCGGHLFDEADPVYRTAALEALDACAATGAVFEVNTGGMFRGYCGEPYPSRFLLEALRKSGARVTVNADAHCTEAVRFRFDETLALLERADVVLHGIGRADEMARKRQLPPAVEAEVLKRGAVSEAYGCYFDRNGKMVCSASTVAHDLGKLKPDCAWIAVAAGTGKAEAIDGAMRAKPHRMLVTDEGAAKAILALPEKECLHA